MVTTGKYAFEYGEAGERAGHQTYNEGLERLATWIAPALVSRGDTTPPVSPADGDAYLIGTSATGEWTDHDGELVDYLGGTPYFFDPFEGLRVRVADENLTIEYDGTNWSAVDGLQTLAFASPIAWNVALGASASVTLTDNGTMGAPTNFEAGRTYTLRVVQDGTGSRTLAWNAVFLWPGGSAPTLSTGAGDEDIFAFWSDGTDWYGTTLGLDYS